MTGLLNSKSSEISAIVFCMIVVVYLGHGVVHPPVALLFFSPNQLLGEVDLVLPNYRSLRKKKVECASIVARVVKFPPNRYSM